MQEMIVTLIVTGFFLGVIIAYVSVQTKKTEKQLKILERKDRYFAAKFSDIFSFAKRSEKKQIGYAKALIVEERKAQKSRIEAMKDEVSGIKKNLRTEKRTLKKQIEKNRKRSAKEIDVLEKKIAGIRAKPKTKKSPGKKKPSPGTLKVRR